MAVARHSEDEEDTLHFISFHVPLREDQKAILPKVLQAKLLDDFSDISDHKKNTVKFLQVIGLLALMDKAVIKELASFRPQKGIDYKFALDENMAHVPFKHLNLQLWKQAVLSWLHQEENPYTNTVKVKLDGELMAKFQDNIVLPSPTNGKKITSEKVNPKPEINPNLN